MYLVSIHIVMQTTPSSSFLPVLLYNPPSFSSFSRVLYFFNDLSALISSLPTILSWFLLFDSLPLASCLTDLLLSVCAIQLAGASYMDIHSSGGGIYYTVSCVHQAGLNQLALSYSKRLSAMWYFHCRG